MGNDNKVAAKWKFNWDDENRAKNMLVGRKIVSIEKVDDYRADLVLDDGTKVAITGNMGRCCSNGDVTIEKLYEGEVTGRIMGINVVDREIEYRANRITLFIMVEGSDLSLVEFAGDEGWASYYGYGFTVSVIE